MNQTATCIECGESLKGDEVLCPQCGAPVTHGGRRIAGTKLFLIFFVVVVVVSALAVVVLPR
ncbi:MAG: hypothetical protein Kow006_08330 [Gammaproteobacteria bacterium]